jgi:hypothetical protein
MLGYVGSLGLTSRLFRLSRLGYLKTSQATFYGKFKLPKKISLTRCRISYKETCTFMEHANPSYARV